MLDRKTHANIWVGSECYTVGSIEDFARLIGKFVSRDAYDFVKCLEEEILYKRKFRIYY